MKENRLTEKIPGIALLCLSLVLAAGVSTVFRGCGPKEDGGFMNCHWAQAVVCCMGVILAVDSLILLLQRAGRSAAAVSAAMIPVEIAAVLIPGRVIPLCMMAEMRCRSVMSPAVSVTGAVMALLSIVSVVLNVRKG